jgi:hypothetical protein
MQPFLPELIFQYLEQSVKIIKLTDFSAEIDCEDAVMIPVMGRLQEEDKKYS